VLLYIHRTFFAKAIIDYPDDPLKSPFAVSFVTAYRSATILLQAMREGHRMLSPMMQRLWIVWAHVLCAAVIVGSVVARCRWAEWTPFAYAEFELAVALFEQADHPAVRRGLPVLLRLREKAKAAYQAANYPTHVPRENGVSAVKVEEDSDDELNVLRGAPRLVSNSRPVLSATSTPMTSPPAMSEDSVSNGRSPSEPDGLSPPALDGLPHTGKLSPSEVLSQQPLYATDMQFSADFDMHTHPWSTSWGLGYPFFVQGPHQPQQTAFGSLTATDLAAGLTVEGQNSAFAIPPPADADAQEMPYPPYVLEQADDGMDDVWNSLVYDLGLSS